MRYKPFAELCDVPNNILDFLNYNFDTLQKNEFPSIRDKGYLQWHNQIEKTMDENPNENEWKDPKFLLINDFFSTYVNTIFRFRLSTLKPKGEIIWHRGHDYPRIHIPLNNTDSVFQLKESKNSDIINCHMVYGKAYLVNVTLFHRVVNNDNIIRKNAFFCFENFVTPELEEKYKLSL